MIGIAFPNRMEITSLTKNSENLGCRVSELKRVTVVLSGRKYFSVRLRTTGAWELMPVSLRWCVANPPHHTFLLAYVLCFPVRAIAGLNYRQTPKASVPAESN